MKPDTMPPAGGTLSIGSPHPAGPNLQEVLMSRFVLPGGNPVHRPAASRRRSLLAPFESLEPRVLLSTYLVTTTADGGPGSLRQAILDADANPGADTIA